MQYPVEVIKYIGRYLGRPVIGMSRIDHYDGEYVTFHYNRHEDNENTNTLTKSFLSYTKTTTTDRIVCQVR